MDCFRGMTILASSKQGILCCRKPSGKTSYICAEIFDSKFWTWRQSKNIIMEGCTGFSFQPTVCIGGIVYLLTGRNTIFAFDSATETQSEFLGPLTATEDEKSYYCEAIVECNGKLGFKCLYKWDEVHLWRLEDNRNYRWEKKRVVEIDKKKNRLIGCSLADMAVMMGYSYQVSGFNPHQNIFPFRSDWEPVDLEDGCMLGGLEEMLIS
nr:F-box protein At5g49610-like [Ipomoea trifida]